MILCPDGAGRAAGAEQQDGFAGQVESTLVQGMQEAQPVRIFELCSRPSGSTTTVLTAPICRCGVAQLIHQRHHGLFVRDGYVDAAEAACVQAADQVANLLRRHGQRLVAPVQPQRLKAALCIAGLTLCPTGQPINPVWYVTSELPAVTLNRVCISEPHSHLPLTGHQSRGQ